MSMRYAVDENTLMRIQVQWFLSYCAKCLCFSASQLSCVHVHVVLYVFIDVNEFHILPQP
jgi:hypothetical protein